MNIYVGNLPYSAEEALLRELFSEYGNIISAKVVTDMFTGKSKGFGFVELEGNSNSIKAIENLNGREIEGRVLKVNESKPRNTQNRDSYNRRK